MSATPEDPIEGSRNHKLPVHVISSLRFRNPHGRS
jgi:hypothetical protein